MIRQVRKTLRGSAGFTLVELVVVIAVLGILAGVGTVGYSGYIQRANEAVDDTLYHDIIYAGAIGSYADPGASGRVTVTKTEDATVSSTSGDQAVVEQWLENAFGSNWRDTVKYKTDTYANGSTTGTIYLPAVEIKLTEPQKELVNKYEDSNFYGNEEELAGAVDGLAGSFADWMTGEASKYGGDYLATLEQYFVDASGDPDPAAFEEFKTFISENVTNTDDPQEIANAMVFYLADQAKGVTASEVISSGDMSAVVGQYGTLPTAAMMYGMMVGFSNTEAGASYKDRLQNISGLSDVMALAGEIFSNENQAGLDYLNNQGEKDLDGYLSALQLIGANQDKIDITLDTDAFNNDSVLAILQGVLNGN